MPYTYISDLKNAWPAKSFAGPKTHTPDPRVKNLGLRYYSTGLGRWINRDPVGERADVNVLGFVRNKPGGAIDPLGLTSIDSAMSLCRELKTDWATVKDRWESTPFFITNPWMLFYLKFLDCPVTFECKPCCPKGKLGENTPKTGIFGGKSCDISICVENIAASSVNMQGVFAHELTHCYQHCTRERRRGCRSCFCREIQAYHREDPSLTQEQLVGKAFDSCMGSTPPQCGQQEAYGISGFYYGNPDIVRGCSLYGDGR